MLDGTYFQHWCLLIATNGNKVIDWQWCDTEKKVAWEQILTRHPAPHLVVTDGGSGLISAIREHWPSAKHQRCFFHIFQAQHRYLTFNPRGEAGQELLALTKTLMKVKDVDHAVKWISQYSSWEAK